MPGSSYTDGKMTPGLFSYITHYIFLKKSSWSWVSILYSWESCLSHSDCLLIQIPFSGPSSIHEVETQLRDGNTTSKPLHHLQIDLATPSFGPMNCHKMSLHLHTQDTNVCACTCPPLIVSPR